MTDTIESRARRAREIETLTSELRLLHQALGQATTSALRTRLRLTITSRQRQLEALQREASGHETVNDSRGHG
jgi:hypothetical protein